MQNQPLYERGVACWHVLHQHEDEFGLGKAHERDGRYIQTAVRQGMARFRAQDEIGWRVCFPPKDFDVVSTRLRVGDRLGEQRWDRELGRDDTPLMVYPHENGESSVEENP